MTHHPSQELVARFATGDLPLAVSLVVKVHLESCSSCCGVVQGIEEAKGQLIASLPDAVMAPDALAKTLARLGSVEPAPAASPPPERLGDLILPRAISSAMVGRQRWLHPGLWIAHIITGGDPEWRTFILRASAKTRFPSHGHPGPELIAVLQGAFEDGERYRAGDFIENAADLEHEIAVADDGACACLVTTPGRLRWGGINRLLGMALDV